MIIFSVQIVVAGVSSEVYLHGINRDLFVRIDNSLPTIKPQRGGLMVFHNHDMTMDSSSNGLGGFASSDQQYWRPCRTVNNDQLTAGAWQCSKFVKGSFVYGILFGTY